MGLARSVVDIDAPIGRVWQVMLDMDRYGEWNPFVVRIDRKRAGEPELGEDFTLNVRWHNGKGVATHERISRLDAPCRAADGVQRAVLEYDFLGPLAALGAVRGRRLQLVEQSGGTVTRYTTEETLHGWLAWAAPLKWVQDGFERHAAALKRRCEALEAQATARA